MMFARKNPLSDKSSSTRSPRGQRASARARTLLLTIISLVAICGQAWASTQTDIRPEPGGKRLLFVDGDDIRPEPGGKRLAYVDEHTIRPIPAGKILLYLDGDDIRDKFGGIRLAYWDGHTLRRRPGGKVLLYIDDNDIRPEPGGKRLLYIDGAKLSRPQLTAVLLQLKPDLFQLSDDEQGKLRKEMADNEAESDAQAQQDAFAGKYSIMVYTSSDDRKQKGSVTVVKQGKYYAVTFDTGDAPAWQGIGVVHVLPDGTSELWAAVGPGAAVSLGVYQAAGGKLTGTWIPVNAKDDPAVLGRETLIGPAGGGGAYKIESGQLPNGGVTYTGSMNIDATKANAGSDAKSFRFRWSTGTTGAAFSSGDAYAVCAGWGGDYEIIRLHPYLGNLSGNFVGKNNDGTYVLSK